MNFIIRSCCRNFIRFSRNSRKGILFDFIQASNAFEIRLCRAQKFTWISDRGGIKKLTDGVLPEKIRYNASVLFFDFRLNFMKAIKKLVLFDQKNYATLGVSWYATLDGVNTVDFLKLLEMPDTFYSWFKIIELHVWMILFQLRQDKGRSRIVSNALIECMWTDVSLRAKSLAPLNKNYKQNTIYLNKHFKTVVFAYDEGYLSDDKTLCNVLWYYFFEQKCDDPRKLESLISYIRYQINHMGKFNLKEMNENEIDKSIWTPFSPHVLNGS